MQLLEEIPTVNARELLQGSNQRPPDPHTSTRDHSAATRKQQQGNELTNTPLGVMRVNTCSLDVSACHSDEEELEVILRVSYGERFMNNAMSAACCTMQL